MASKTLTMPILLFSILSSLLPQGFAKPSPTPVFSNPSFCPSPTGFMNTIIRAPLPSAPTLQLNPSFLTQHLLFFYTDQNTALSQAAFASFCLHQCIAYQPNPNATDLSTDANSLPASYVTNRPGPCLSFTVDMGKPYPPSPNDSATRWFCEAFDKYLAEDGSDFVPIDAPGSYIYGLGVNRACTGDYRAY